MKIHSPVPQDLEPMVERIRSKRVAMLTLPIPHQGLQSRPMTPLELDADGCIWMMVSRASLEKVGLSSQGVPTANLAYSDEGDSTYVSITGRLSGVDDARRKQEVWSLVGRPWFDGPDDPDLLLLSLRPQHVEIWDGPHSVVVKALALAASVAAARPIGLGDHQVIEPGKA